VLSLAALSGGSRWAPILAMLGVGAAAALANGPIQAIFQAVVPAELQGRVFTLLASLSGAMTPIGLLLATPVADLAGIRVWYVVAGGVCLAAGGAGFLIPAIARIEDGATPVAVEPSQSEEEAAAPPVPA
jgi:DHA3 family macrolide efflux protein-like MFS transporter